MSNVLAFTLRPVPRRVQGPTGSNELDLETLLDLELEGVYDPRSPGAEIIAFPLSKQAFA